MTFGGNRVWLIQFTDLVSLLLTFAVLLYAMRDPTPGPWFGQAVEQALPTPGTQPATATGDFQPLPDIPVLETPALLDLRYLAALLRTRAEGDGTLAQIGIVERPDGLLLSLPAQLTFAPGSAEIAAAGRAVLTDLGAILSRIRNGIEVHGRTDPTPITRGAYANNWDLALARAGNAATVLRDTGYRRDILIYGQVGLPGTDPAESRRVDILIRPGA